jgi:hypothetical protein
MSTNANVFRSLRRPKWLRDALQRGGGSRLRRPGRVQQAVARRRRIGREAIEQARRAWAPSTGTFSFGDSPAERRRRRRVRSKQAAQVRFYAACACGTVLGYALFLLLFG